MSWQAEMGVMVRHLVDDIDVVRYVNERVEESIVVAAQLLILDIDFESNYTIDIDSICISPDPTLAANRDDSFINLVSLKSACLILNGEMKTSSDNAVKIVDGPSTMDLTGVGEGTKETYKAMCKMFDEAKLQFKTNGAVGVAILSPYNPGSNFIR